MTVITLREESSLYTMQQMGDDLMLAKAAWVSTNKQLKADLLDDPLDPANAARIEKAVRGVLKFLMENRHGTPFECGGITVRVEAPIFIWREWHRHRIGFSYNELSGRYTVLPSVFYVPGSERGRNCLKPADFKPSKPGWRGFLPIGEQKRKDDNAKMVKLYQEAYDLYEERLAAGYDNGLARIGLPVGIFSTCYVTCNPRSLMSFLELRTDAEPARQRSHPLWELDRLSGLLEEEFKKYWPITHELWNANGRQAP